MSGLPRSGTSMMMRMLACGGATILADETRLPDSDNPRGYFELEAVKRTATDASWLHGAPGRVVKVVSTLLCHLPPTASYRILFMRRSLDQIVRSQRAMLDRIDASGTHDDAEARQAMAEHLAEVAMWFETARHVRALGVSYERVVAQPEREINRIIGFLELPLDAAAMRQAVEPALHRQK